jgi:hypothetical protein
MANDQMKGVFAKAIDVDSRYIIVKMVKCPLKLILTRLMKL